MSGYRKATSGEVTERVATVYKLIVSGAKRRDVLRYIADKTTWGVSERTVDFYLQRAHKQLEAEAAINRPRELGKAAARFEMLFFEAHSLKDVRGALAAEKERASLLGLYAPLKQEHTGKDGAPIRQELTIIEPDADAITAAADALRAATLAAGLADATE